jgi:universal stress protein A
MDIQRILVPVDYSDHSKHALEYAAGLASRFGAKIDVVHVWDRPSYVPDTLIVPKGETMPRSLTDLIREGAEREMDEFLASATLPKDVAVAHHLESGEPASTLIKRFGEHPCDLLVVGTHGRSGVRHLLLGSVAEKLVRLSPVPVLTVPLFGQHRAAATR